jgi:hypothetical protein
LIGHGFGLKGIESFKEFHANKVHCGAQDVKKAGFYVNDKALIACSTLSIFIEWA